MRRALICFTRPPAPGRTKTRLMPLLSGEECAALHTAFLRDIAAVCGRVDADLYVAYAPEGDWGILRELFPAALDLFPQDGEGLGERMHRALSRVLALGYEACVLIGSDLPELTEGHLAAAFAALEEADASLGPTEDGGYYLVGLKKPCRALFAGQAYGHECVYENALAAIRGAGLRFRPAPPCRDVDVPEDLCRLPGTVRPDSHTARLLKILEWEGRNDGLIGIPGICPQRGLSFSPPSACGDGAGLLPPGAGGVQCQLQLPPPGDRTAAGTAPEHRQSDAPGAPDRI